MGIEQSTTRTKTGAGVSSQISNLGVITDLNTADFSLPDGSAFLLKNDSGVNVALTVVTELSTTPVATIFAPGWNPELIKSIKLNPALAGVSLIWGK